MKRYVWVPLVAALIGNGQTRIDLHTQSKPASGIVLPAVCGPGEQFLLTNAGAGQDLHICLLGNEWTAVRADLPGPAGQGDGKVLASNSTGAASWRGMGGDVSGRPEQLQVLSLSGRKISSSAPMDGDLMKWNEALQEWGPSAVAGSYTVGLGLVLAGTTIGIEDAIIPIYSVGSGSPTGSCVAGRDIYTDTASGLRWFCKTGNSWQQLALAGHVHTASEVASGVLDVSRMPAYSGDATSNAGSSALTVTGIQGRLVDSGAPADGQGLRWNAAASKWQPANWSTSDIQSGTLSVARGGTGQGVWSAGQCVRVSADGTQLESAGADCGPGASLTGVYSALVAQACTAARAGLVALPQDSYYDLLRCDGAGTWQHFLGGRLATAPAATGWSWVNQGTATMTTGGGAVVLDLPADSGSNNLRAVFRTVPAAPWHVRAGLRCTLLRTGNSCGMVLRESGSGKLIVFGLAQTGGERNAPVLVVARYSSPTAAPTVILEMAWGGGARDLLLEIRDDGTNRVFAASADGHLWKTLLTEPRDQFLVAGEYGVGGEAASTLLGPSLVTIHWEAN